MSRVIDLTGQKFGRLLVLERGGNSKNGRAVWRCKCDCGNFADAQSYLLRAGMTKSCGCLKSDNGRVAAKRLEKHGAFRKHRDKYQLWRSMVARCHDEKCPQFKDYGAKGVYVCDEWRTFPGFIEWAKDRPEGLTIDRIDPSGPYSPDNCRWATHLEQQNNRRHHVWVEHQGQRYTATQFARKLGIKPWAIYNGIKDKGDPFHYIKDLI